MRGSDLLPVVPQGDYDQSRAKVLHLSLNPASAARQRLHEDRQRLREECARLRELVHALEAGGAVPPDLEATAGLPSSREVAGRPPSVRPSVCPAPCRQLGCGHPRGCAGGLVAPACRAAGDTGAMRTRWLEPCRPLKQVSIV